MHPACAAAAAGVAAYVCVAHTAACIVRGWKELNSTS